MGGGHLSKDFRQGYGPEVYLLKNPPAGSYRVRTRYYASHQQSSLTGATSAVIWALCGGEKPELRFDMVRLDRNKEMMDVMTVAVEGDIFTHEFTDTGRDVVRLACESAEVITDEDVRRAFHWNAHLAPLQIGMCEFTDTGRDVV